MLDDISDSIKRISNSMKYMIGMGRSPEGRRNAVLGIANRLNDNWPMYLSIVIVVSVLGFYGLAGTFAIGIPALSTLGYSGANSLFTGMDALGVFLPAFKRFTFQIMVGILGIGGLILFTIKYHFSSKN